MATTRIKDITTAASTFSSDDFVAIDGATSGTRKMAKADLISEVSSGVSGTYLEESNNLSDVASLDTSKLNMEIPDVGSSPDQVSLNGMLGDMAFQSSDGVSMGVVEADSLDVGGQSKAGSLVVYDANGNASNSLDVTYSGSSGVANIQADSSGGSTALTFGTSNAGVVATRMTIDSSGRVGIGTASPGSYNYGADDLVIGDATGVRGLTIASANNLSGRIFFADPDSPTSGQVRYDHSTDKLSFATGGADRWSINSSGNLVANGTAIDFGSVAEGSGTPVTNGGLLDDYESGTLTATLTPSNSGTITLASANSLAYVKVGNLVTVTGKIGVSSVSSPSGSYVYLNLPFTVGSAVRNRCAGTVLISAAASNINTYGVVVENGGSTALICSTDGTSLGGGTTADDFSGNEELHINISYIAA